MLRLFRMVYCPDFLFNIVSFQRLEERGIDWSHRHGIFIVSKDTKPLGHTRKMYRQYILEHRPVSEIYTAIVITAGVRRPSKQPSGRQSKDIKIPTWVSTDL